MCIHNLPPLPAPCAQQTSNKQMVLFDPAHLKCSYSLYRALSLRNLVSGYKCGRVFPADVEPGSPSRDAANWLPSRFGLSGETRRRYGWLRMVFPGARLFRAPIWCPSGGWRHARGREHCRGDPGSAHSGGTHQIRRRRRAARSSTSQGRAEPLCERNHRLEPGGF